ncbi:hypothetical protein M6B38_263905 [Iris pallida]|uniref:Uncharacterized protein n=1 Tax=Iris pallida TaxID=29817 RepID=A0AAX6IBM1_IRIPA|nr:hypothetical protein M6B38_263905 [Iris pallida]
MTMRYSFLRRQVVLGITSFVRRWDNFPSSDRVEQQRTTGD